MNQVFLQVPRPIPCWMINVIDCLQCLGWRTERRSWLPFSKKGIIIISISLASSTYYLSLSRWSRRSKTSLETAWPHLQLDYYFCFHTQNPRQEESDIQHYKPTACWVVFNSSPSSLLWPQSHLKHLLERVKLFFAAGWPEYSREELKPLNQRGSAR